jgi:hypothetical protein
MNPVCQRSAKLYKVEGYFMDDNRHTAKPQQADGRSLTRFRLGIVAIGIGVGAVLAYLLSKAQRSNKEAATRKHVAQHIVDDRGTGQIEAAQILSNLRDRAFEASDEKLAIALGRPIEEVAAWHAGRELIDDDVVMKARGIAMNRGIHIE